MQLWLHHNRVKPKCCTLFSTTTMYMSSQNITSTLLCNLYFHSRFSFIQFNLNRVNDFLSFETTLNQTDRLLIIRACYSIDDTISAHVEIFYGVCFGLKCRALLIYPERFSSGLVALKEMHTWSQFLIAEHKLGR